MKLRNIILFAVTTFLFASCATTMTQRKTVDDLYYNPSEQTSYNYTDELDQDYKSILENDSLKDIDSTVYGKKEKSYESGYDRVLVDDYDEAYQKRRDAMRSPYYGINNYYNIMYSDDWWYANAYDPMFHNIIVMGNNVWVEPHWLTSHFGYGYRYGSYFNSPYNYHRNYYWPSSFYSGFGFNYGYSGFGYGYYGYGYGYNSGYYSGYYGGLNGYGYYPYHSTFPTYEFKRKGEHNLRSLSRDNSNAINETSQSTRTRLLNDQQLNKNTASGENRETIRTRSNAESRDGERLRSTNNLREDGRDERYIRRADSRDNERGTSTYNRVERTSSDKFNQRNKENTLSRYIEAADRERSSVVNHRYNSRPNNETTRSSDVRNIIRSSDNNSSTVRRRSTYSRPNNNSSSNNHSGSTIRSNSGSSNNNSSGSTIRRSSSSSGNSSSTRTRSSSSSSSGGRKRK